ncbi:MAG TPA: anti-sigma factor [Granulicella sp.]
MNDSPQCEFVQASFSAYLDGELSGVAMQQMAEHLDTCSECSREFTAWRSMQDQLAMLRTDAKAKAPMDLGLKLRIAISHESSRRAAGIFNNLSVRWENTLRPWLLQAAAGFVAAVSLLGGVGLLLGAAPQPVLANDEPLSVVIAPHYLYSAEQPRPILTQCDATIVVDALINTRGQVYDYTIVSGPQDPAIRPQLESQLLSSVFTPASVFGSPVRGRVVMTFSGVSVRA